MKNALTRLKDQLSTFLTEHGEELQALGDSYYREFSELESTMEGILEDELAG